VTGVEDSARAIGASLGYEASKVAKRRKTKDVIAMAMAAAAADGSIIAEGDSWFNLPSLWPRTMLDFLQEKHPLINLAMWGDEMGEMLLKGEYIAKLHAGKVKYLLFSGGGNDVLGGKDFRSFLRLYDPFHDGPEFAAYYVREEFYANLDVVEGLYRTLIDVVRKASPGTVLVVHGYDYAIPKRDGQWLGRPMAIMGLHPVDRKEICRAIIRLMIDQFNARLAQLADEFSNVRYVKLVGTVKANEWFDELHAMEAATRRMATRLAGVLA
jgi:lysophospholipase L1-like esterase